MAGPIDLDEVAGVENEARSRFVHRALVCSSTGCLSAGAAGARAAIEEDLATSGRSHDVHVVPTGCPGLCSRGPLVHVDTRGEAPTLYEHVDDSAARTIVREHLIGGEQVADGNIVPQDIPFFARQEKVVLANAGLIDPDRLEDYVAVGGYRALAKAVTSMSPDDVIATIEESGLRGRGGAGYPTAKKWSLLRSAPDEHKYVVANGDEGDPGAYMDRTIMDSDPHRVLEGITIAAYATGADRGYVYVRAEYPLAIERLDRAIRAAKRVKLLGRDILGSGFAFDLEIRVGAGAFVCGEETALMASIEGRRGLPQLRPPYPTERGLWGKPTMINNVETLSNVPAILDREAG